MGYLADFDEDVFISYAHNDDDTYLPEPKGWVAQLHTDLEQRVKVHLGAEPRLWRDCEIRNYEDFANKILSRLVKTALFLSVISPSFIERPWCQRELQEFVESAQRTLGIRIDEEKFRIFKVEKVPVNRNSLPVVLQGMESGSYKFYGPDPRRDGSVHEFRPLLGGEYFRSYFEEMDELAKDIAAVLREMAQKVQGVVPAGRPVLAVYLAEPTSDLQAESNEIRRDLKDRGYVVLPPGDLPHRASEFTEKVRGWLKRSALSVHLVGNEYGFVPEGEATKSSAWLQHELAMERNADPTFLRLVWMRSDVRPADVRQRSFVQYLQEDPAVQRGADVLQTTLEDLKAAMLDQLRELQERAERKAQGKDSHKRSEAQPGCSPSAVLDEPLRIYLICDQLDRTSGSFLALRKYLFNQGFEPILPPQSWAASEALQEHATNLEICDACLIYYGAGSEQWFEAKLMDFRKFLKRRQHRVLAKAIYVAPPENTSKSELETHEAMVLRGTESFSPESLAPFESRLRTAAPG